MVVCMGLILNTYHSSEGWRDQPAVDGDETAAHQCLWKQQRCNDGLASQRWCKGKSVSPPPTWMSSSFDLKSDTSTFSPSETRVSDTYSLPEARTCASLGRSRLRPVFSTLTRLKDGWRGPRFLFLASLATSITSSQHLAVNKEEKAALVKDDGV